MVGTLQLARALTDRDLSDGFLARSAETALELLADRGMTRRAPRAARSGMPSLGGRSVLAQPAHPREACSGGSRACTGSGSHDPLPTMAV